jgi:hypothetical protein
MDMVEPRPEDPHDRFWQQAIDTALAYGVAQALRGYSEVHRKSNAEMAKSLRDSLGYRSGATAWHLAQLSAVQSSAVTRMRQSMMMPNATGDIMRSAARIQQYLFDDVVFNAIALFDYVANMVGLAFYGDRRRKAKWATIQKFARDPDTERKSHPAQRISERPIGALIIAAEETFVGPLSDYRAALIHYETVPAGGGVETRLGAAAKNSSGISFELAITVPKPFTRRLVVPGFEQDPTKAPLLKAAEWVNAETHYRSTAILRQLERDLREESGRDPDGTDRLITMG